MVHTTTLLAHSATGHGCGLGVAAGFLSLLSSLFSSVEPPNNRPQNPFFFFSASPGLVEAPGAATGTCAELVGALDTGEAGLGSRPKTLWKIFPCSPDWSQVCVGCVPSMKAVV